MLIHGITLALGLIAGAPLDRPLDGLVRGQAVDELARNLVLGGDTAPTRARALYESLLALRSRGTLRWDRTNAPKARDPKTAATLAQLILDPQLDANREVGCFELTLLYVALARAQGLETVGAERVETRGVGQIGHVMAAVRVPSGFIVYDLQNAVPGSREPVRLLSDAELAAHHHNHVAVAAYLGGRSREALRAIDRALALAPHAPSYLSNRSVILGLLGELPQAQAEAAQAAALAPSVPLFRYQLGRLAWAEGDRALAQRHFEAAVALAPDYEVARRDLERLRTAGSTPHAPEADPSGPAAPK